MGTAVAMHVARLGHDTTLWANDHDLRAYAALREERKHPLLPEHLPDGVQLYGPNELAEAAEGAEIAVMGAELPRRPLARADGQGVDRRPVRRQRGEGARAGLGPADVRGLRGGAPGRGRRRGRRPCLATELARGTPHGGRLGRGHRGRRPRGRRPLRRPALPARLHRRRHRCGALRDDEERRRDRARHPRRRRQADRRGLQEREGGAVHEGRPRDRRCS